MCAHTVTKLCSKKNKAKFKKKKVDLFFVFQKRREYFSVENIYFVVCQWVLMTDKITDPVTFFQKTKLFDKKDQITV
jgi:hypothetical protein